MHGWMVTDLFRASSAIRQSGCLTAFAKSKVSPAAIIKDYIGSASSAAGRYSCRWRVAGHAEADFGEALVEIGSVVRQGAFLRA
jgi:hypothetical protein